MKRPLSLIFKAIKLILAGYSGYFLYRSGRFLRALINRSSIDFNNCRSLTSLEIFQIIETFNTQFRPTSQKALVVHAYYPDTFQEILKSPLVQQEPVDLWISVSDLVTADFFESLKIFKGRVKLFYLENKGRDVYPFLKIMPELASANYEWVCKLHSKRSPKQIDGELWRRDLYRELLSLQTSQKLNSTALNILAPRQSLLPVDLFMGGNFLKMRELFQLLNVPVTEPYQFLFIAGTMFWLRPQSLNRLLSLTESLDSLFEPEIDVIDGTTAHAFERIFYYLATN